MSKPRTDQPTVVHIPARRSCAAWVGLLVAGGIGLVADLWSKHAAFEHIADTPVVIDRSAVLASHNLADLIPNHDPVTFAPGLLDLTLVLNPGAVFGIGAGQRWFFVGFTVVAIALCVAMFGWWTRARDHASHIAFGLVIAGGLGNLYDRLAFGCVRDFLHPLPGVALPFGFRWPGGGSELWPYVSNVADALLIVGIAMLVIRSIWHDQPEHGPKSKRD